MTTKKNKIVTIIKNIDTYLFLGLISLIRRKLLKLISVKRVNKNNFFYQTHYNNRNNQLNLLCDKYGSDKGEVSSKLNPYPWPSHNYTDFYSLVFGLRRNEIKTIVECGIGTNNPALKSSMGVEGKPGASLRMWREYFPNAQVYGADIDKRILFEEERIKTFYVDQTNPESIKYMWDEIKKANFDVIIDDGLHTSKAAITLFENSFKKLKPNGIYIIEDVKIEDSDQILKYFDNDKYNTQLISIKCPYRKRNFLLMLIRNK